MISKRADSASAVYFKYKRMFCILHKKSAAKGNFQYGKCVSHRYGH